MQLASGLLYGLHGDGVGGDRAVDGDGFAGEVGEGVGVGDLVYLVADDEDCRRAALDALLGTRGVLSTGGFCGVLCAHGI